MKYIIFLCCFFLIACNKEKYNFEQINLSNSILLDSAEVIYNFDDRYPVELSIKDSLAYIICAKTDTCLCIVNLNKHQIDTVLGHVGYGPKDLISPNFISSTDKSRILLQTANLKKIMEIENNRGKINLEEYIPYPDPIFISSELNFSNKYIVGRKMDGEKGKMFFIYNQQNDQILFHECYPPLSKQVKDKNYVYAPSLAINESKDRIIVGMYFFDMFHIYNFSGERINTFCFTNDCTPKIDQETGFLDLSNGYSGIIRTYPTEDFCFLLRQTTTPQNNTTFTLIQLNWDGQLIHSYIFKDRVSGQFCIDKDIKKVYIIRNQIQSGDKEIFSIVSYNLN